MEKIEEYLKKIGKRKVCVYVCDTSKNIDSIGRNFIFSKEKYDICLNKVTSKIPKIKHLVEDEYIYNDLTMVIDQQSKITVTQNIDFKSFITGNLLILVQNDKIISNENFPLVDKYHSRKLKIIKQFYWMPITINFIEDRYDNNSQFYLEFVFNNHSEKSEWLLKNINNILKYLDLY
jgi:hypothetical protein